MLVAGPPAAAFKRPQTEVAGLEIQIKDHISVKKAGNVFNIVHIHPRWLPRAMFEWIIDLAIFSVIADCFGYEAY